ncbi:MAG: acylphosphatase, partial [Anaerolineae bacterium]
EGVLTMQFIRMHVWIRGVVQGVFFRQSTRRQAQAAGVTGWVRNCADGAVEAVFEGEAAAVASVVSWCHHGPAAAVVSQVDVAGEPYTGEFSLFKISGW